MITSNSKLLDTRGDLLNKMSDLSTNHFNEYMTIQKEFSKIREEFILTGKTVEYHKEVFDSLQSTLELYKKERVEIKKRMDELYVEIGGKVLRDEF